MVFQRDAQPLKTLGYGGDSGGYGGGGGGYGGGGGGGMYFPLVVFDRLHSYTYCTPFQAMEDVADMMTVVAEVCGL